MQALRQLGGGVIIAIVSLILVFGGIFLSLAETLPSPATPTPVPPTLPLSFPTPTAGIATATPIVQFETPTATASPTPTASLFPTVQSLPGTPILSCAPPSGWIRVITASGDSVYSLAQRYKTSAESLSTANCLTSFDLPAGFALYVPPVPTVTVIPCGPPAGWVKAHVVQPGDNLYRIALSYGISYPQLQRGNCMGNSVTIYAGQRLWVPNIPTLTPIPGVTNIPSFPTDTLTLAPTATNALPTSTFTEPPTATQIFIPTATPSITPFPSQASPQ